MKNENLKRLAMNAKNRLVKKENSFIDNIRLNSGNICKFKVIENEDEDFNLKAKQVYEKEIFNPINELIDEKYFASLTDNSKQRYLFEVIEKYSKFRKQQETECNKQMSIL